MRLLRLPWSEIKFCTVLVYLFRENTKNQLRLCLLSLKSDFRNSETFQFNSDKIIVLYRFVFIK